MSRVTVTRTNAPVARRKPKLLIRMPIKHAPPRNWMGVTTNSVVHAEG